MVRKKSEQQAGLQPLKVEQSTNTSYLVAIILCFLALFLGKWEIIVVPTTAKNTSVTFISNHKDFQEVSSLAKFTLEKSVWALLYPKPRPYWDYMQERNKTKQKLNKNSLLDFYFKQGTAFMQMFPSAINYFCDQSRREKG